MKQLTGPSAEIYANFLKEIFNRKNYSFFTKGNFNLNLIGIRNKSKDPSLFDDSLICVYKSGNIWNVESYEITTEPGPSILQNPLDSVEHKGTAILVPGQYKSVYKIGWHGSANRGHEALVQRGGPVSVYRDNDRNRVPDYHAPEESGWFGINIHKHSGGENRINTGGVSAGCQVFRSSIDFINFMDTCSHAAAYWGNSFTYTLINQTDLHI